MPLFHSEISTIIYLTQRSRLAILCLYDGKPQSPLGLSEKASFTRSSSSRFTLLTSFRRGTSSSGLPVLRFRFFLRGSAMTLLDVNRMYNTDDRCREVLTKLRWPNGVECPRCKSKDILWIHSRKQFDCRECEYQFSATSGTIFNDSHLPLQTWFLAVLLLVEARKGFSANQMKRTLGISYKTAWYLCHRIRYAMTEVHKALDGVVEMDETYVGGRRLGLGVFEGKQNKEIVIGIRKRGGDLKFIHARDASAKVIREIVGDHVSEDVEVIVTDESAIYPAALRSKKERHVTVNHKAKEYVRGMAYTNTVESAFSLLKRGIIGTWHRVSAKHLSAYLNEMTFRFNRRKHHDLFLDTLRHMVTAPTLTFETLIA